MGIGQIFWMLHKITFIWPSCFKIKLFKNVFKIYVLNISKLKYSLQRRNPPEMDETGVFSNSHEIIKENSGL